MKKTRCYIQKVPGFPISSYAIYTYDGRIVETGFRTWIEAQNWGSKAGYDMEE